MMDKKEPEAKPGDGIRSLRSTMLFRTVNFELYARQNKVVMIFGAITMLSCLGYIFYMRQKYDSSNYYTAVETDGTLVLKKKTSKWID